MKNQSTETVLYRFGIGAAVCFAALFLMFRYIPSLHAFLNEWVCPFRALTGLYCPGCGGTRAILAMLRGQLGQSFLYHPAVLTGTGIYLAFMLSQILERLSKGRIRGLRWRNLYLWIWIGVILINWAVQNLGIFQNYFRNHL